MRTLLITMVLTINAMTVACGTLAPSELLPLTQRSPDAAKNVKLKGLPGVPDQKAVYDLAWSRNMVAVNETLQALFSINKFADGDIASISFYEIGMDNAKTLLESRSVRLVDGTGHYAIAWSHTLPESKTDFEQDDKAMQSKPIEYIFNVEVDDVSAESNSNALWLTRPLEIIIEQENPGDPLTRDGTIVALKMGNGRTIYTETVKQRAFFKAVIIGPISFEVIGQKHKIVE